MKSNHRAVALTLYRNILRASKPFTSTSPPNGHGHILCSLLYRSGDDDFVDYAVQYPPPSTHSKELSEKGGGKNTEDDADTRWKDVRLSKEEARDLTRTYDELRQASSSNLYSSAEGGADDDPLLEMGLDTDHGEVLFRRLLRKVLGEGVHMNFSSQAVDVAHRLRDCVRDEFRCPSIDASESGDGDGDHDRNRGMDLISRGYSDQLRRNTAFMTLRELERKLRWAESMGFAFSISNTDSGTHTSADKDTPSATHTGTDTDKYAGTDTNAANSHTHQANITTKYLNQQKPTLHEQICDLTEEGFLPLPTQNPSSYLRPGSFLVAHPLLNGYFSRTVIAILEHTNPSSAIDGESASKGEGKFSSGGTYGVIVNRYHSAVINDNTHIHANRKRRRKKTLEEVFQPNCLPKGMRASFGDVEVRDGGPINLSLQMIRLATVEEEEAAGIGGAVVPRIVDCEGSEGEQIGEPLSQAQNTGSAIFFGGDVIRAAQSVIDGEMNRDHFSFFVGASCWEPGQLENEIQRGYWLPCAGPPDAVLTGTCPFTTYKTATATVKRRWERKQKNSKNAGAEDLWLSAMCALGEGDLAHLILSKEDGGELYDSNGLACDDF